MTMMIANSLGRLKRAESGVAYLEFALALPIVMVITMYGLEVAWIMINQQKVNQIAAVTADNAARVRGKIDETNINEILEGARIAGAKMGFADNGRLILSSIQANNARTGQWIRWQRCAGSFGAASRYGPEDKGRNDASLQGVGHGPNPMRAPPGNAIMLVEAAFDYQPLISGEFFGPKTLRAETAFLVRDRTDLDVGDTTNIPRADQRTCDDGNNGGGNDPGGVDPSNPGQGGGQGRT